MTPGGISRSQQGNDVHLCDVNYPFAMPEQSKTTFELVNELIIALSHLLWPILTFVVVLVFRNEISGILKRLKKGKFLGQKVELDEEIEKFKTITTSATDSIPPENSPEKTEKDDTVENIFTKSAEDPKIGIMLLSREIEIELTSLIASMGFLNEYKRKSLSAAFELLQQREYVPESVLSSVKIFSDLRNKVIHGKHIEDESRIIRVLDIGATLLDTIKSIPHERHYVHRTNVKLYSDPNCTQAIPGAVGVVIESVSSDKGDKHYRIFPTLKKDYRIGDEVSWEWSFANKWNETWYRDEEAGEIKMAWSSAGEFVGRPIRDL